MKLRVFENMVLRRIFGPRRDEVTGEWRSLHNEELNDLYCSPSVVLVIKSRRMRLVVTQILKIKIYRTIILPVVLYGCETLSLTLREQKKLRVFENMVLRRIFVLGGTR